MPAATAPNPADDEAFFWEGARRGRLLLQRCGACKAFCHPPLPMCPDCQSLQREIVESTGRGSVYSWIRSRHPSDPGSESRIAALVQLEEGVRLVANLCCQESEGGVAMIVTTGDRARDARNPVARVVATAESKVFGGHVVFNHYHEDLTTAREATSLAAQIFGASGVTRDDIDAVMIYGNFSPSVFLQLEGLGFCGPGEARDFIAEGNIELRGKSPVNAHGGLLGEGYIHGMNNVLEAVRQIRGTSVNQIAGASHVLATATRSALLLAGLS